ncbi:MAG TPA: hypothetical protein VFM01_01205 [Nakamurella sp.]|nr:hypothetical protein [Nakamurella sp.]
MPVTAAVFAPPPGLVTAAVLAPPPGPVTDALSASPAEGVPAAVGGLPAVTNLLAGSLLVIALLIVWRRELRAIVVLLGVQGAVLAALPIAYGAASGEPELIAVGAAMLVLRAWLLPAILARVVAADRAARRETAPLVGTAGSLLACAVLIVLAFAVSRPVIELRPDDAAVRAVPAAVAVLLIAVFTMAARRQALSQAVGFLMLDNAITAAAFLLAGGIPLIVELGASLDVLFAMLVLGVLATRMRRVFGDTDLHRLQELRD